MYILVLYTLVLYTFACCRTFVNGLPPRPLSIPTNIYTRIPGDLNTLVYWHAPFHRSHPTDI